MLDHDVSSTGRVRWKSTASILFGIAVVAALTYLYIQMAGLRSDLARFHESTQKELASLRENTISVAAHAKNIEALREELEAAREQATKAVGQAKTEASKRAEVLKAQLADAQRKQAALSTQLSEVKETATVATAGVGEVRTEVGSVKSDVAATRTELDKTVNQLRQVTGDMGVMSGLIATNGKELDALKQLGDRNYYDFDLKKAKAPQRIGDIAVLLKRVDQKRNRYTIEVLADDKKVEKRDKNVNEPVQFYVSKARQPYELVVNDIRKDQIIGYLATPRVKLARD